MVQKFANAARAYLASTVSDSATTVTIDGGGSLFPAITSPEFSRAVLQDANGIEVVLITAHTAGSDTFTVTRGQEGTTARSFATGSVFGIRMTSADGDTFVAKQNALVSGTNIKTVNGDSLLGSGNLAVSGGLEYSVKTANYTAVDKQGVLADTSGGAFTVTLPATPAAGAQVVVADAGNSWGTNNLTVARNGSTISNLAEDLVCDINGVSAQFVYDGTTWEVYAQIGGGGGNAVTLTGTQTLTNKTLTNPAINGSTTVGGDVKLYEGSDNGTNFVALKAPNSLAGNVTWTLPTADGTNLQVLATNGSGALSWASGGGSGDVVGPASATNNGIALFDGTTGKLLKNSSAQDGLIHGITVGRGAGAVSTNTAVGVSVLAANTTGAFNTAVGELSLTRNTTGSLNTAVGRETLNFNTTGQHNTSVGHDNLYANTTGSFNTAFGSWALQANTTANNNTAVGYQAGYTNTTGNNMVAVGRLAAYTNSTGSNITAVGNEALKSTTVGNNTAVGTAALFSNTTGQYNVALGQHDASGFPTLYSNTTGTENTAVGSGALAKNTTANNNTAVGYLALNANTTSGSNTAVGAESLKVSTTGPWNAAYGTWSLRANTTGYCNTAIGGLALLNCTTGNSNIQLGGVEGAGINYSPVFNVTTENNRLVMGHSQITNAYVQVAWTVVSDARDKTNFAPVTHGLDFVNQLNPVSYQFKETRESDVPHGPVRYGFKAQEILALEGDSPVIIDNEDSEKLRYNGEALVPVLVKAIQELTAQVETLKAEMAALKGN